MAVKNVVVAGDYKGYIDFKNKKKGLYIYGTFGLGKKTFINKDTVQSYEVIGVEGQKSMSSGIIKGAVGGALFGGIGALPALRLAKTRGSILFPSSSRMGRSVSASSTTICTRISSRYSTDLRASVKLKTGCVPMGSVAGFFAVLWSPWGAPK